VGLDMKQNVRLQLPLSPQRGEGLGVRVGNSQTPRQRRKTTGILTPHPRSLSPLRGEGGPLAHSPQDLHRLHSLSAKQVSRRDCSARSA
jgi:hypothetical protein